MISCFVVCTVAQAGSTCVDRQDKIITKVYGGGRTQIPEKVREKLCLRDDDYVVWFNDYAGRWCIEKVRI